MIEDEEWSTAATIHEEMTKCFIVRKLQRKIQREREPPKKRSEQPGSTRDKGTQRYALSANRFIWRVRTSPRITCYQASLRG